MLKLIVDSQRLRLQQELIAGESVNVLTCKALFRSSDWDGMHKYLHLRQGDAAKDWILINDEITADQHVDLTAGEWELWLHGTEYDGELVKRRITTNVCKIRVDDTGAIDGEFFPSVTPSAAEQAMARAALLLAEADEMMKELEELKKEAEIGALGEPTVAVTSADMTDPKLLYVYTGKEVDYVRGYWYYWDKHTEQWTVGGVYGNITGEMLEAAVHEWLDENAKEMKLLEIFDSDGNKIGQYDGSTTTRITLTGTVHYDDGNEVAY